MAEIAYAYAGSVNYEELKKYPSREIHILTTTMNEINERKNAAIKSRTGVISGSTIGAFEPS